MRIHLPPGRPPNPRRHPRRLLTALALVAPLVLGATLTGTASAKTVKKATGDFRVIIAPDSRAVVAGQRATFPVRLQALRGFKFSNTSFDINAPDSVDAEIARVGKTSANTFELDLTPAANFPTSSNVYRLTVTSNRVVRFAVLRLDVQGTAAPIIPTTAPPVVLSPTPSATPTTIAPSFTLRPLLTSAAVTTGETARFQVDVDRPTGYAGNVTFTLAGVPSGMSANFAPNPTVKGTVLYVTPSASVPSGRYTIIGTAIAGTVVRTVQFTVDVRTLADFTMLPNRTAVTLTAPGNATYTLTPTGINGITPWVSYAVTGLPSGTTSSFSANPTSAATTLTVTTSAATPNGTYNLTITGTSGTYTRSQIVQLVVSNVSPGFGIAAVPDAITVTRGGVGVPVALNVSTFGGFAGTVSIGTAGAPTGVTATVTVNSASSATVTVSATSGAAAGVFNLSISGTSGSYAATVQVRVTVV